MGIFDGCFLASDIDGTLLENGRVNPANLEKIKYFISEGGKFSLASGRTIGGIGLVMPMFGDIDIAPCVLGNGSTIYDFRKKRMLAEKTLVSGSEKAAAEVMEAMPQIGIEVHAGEKIFVIRNTAEVQDHIDYEALKTEKVTLEYASQFKWNKVNFFATTLQEREELKKITAKFIGVSDFVDTGAFINNRVRYYHEQVPPGVSKAESLVYLCSELRIKKDGFFAIGDYYNDLEMIKRADIGAVTAEAPDDVKAYADFIACGVADGAVADFIDYLITVINDGN